jgi:uncharacterized protein YutE (UPF0331/DUF86 family)
MRKVPLNREVIESRLKEIRDDLMKLEDFKKMSLEEYKTGHNFAASEHYLRRALEAMLEIGTHILSRLPGAKPQVYKDIPKLLGENNVIPKDFADGKLTEMVGYRNRLIHFYKVVTQEELYNIIQNNLLDLEEFCRYVIDYMEKA